MLLICRAGEESAEAVSSMMVTEFSAEVWLCWIHNGCSKQQKQAGRLDPEIPNDGSSSDHQTGGLRLEELDPGIKRGYC